MPYLDLFGALWLQIERLGRFQCNECNILVKLSLGCNGSTGVARNFAVNCYAVYATLVTIDWLLEHTFLYTIVFPDVLRMNKAAFGPRLVRPNSCPHSESYSLSSGILELYGVRPLLQVRVNRSTVGNKAGRTPVLPSRCDRHGGSVTFARAAFEARPKRYEELYRM